MATEKPRVLQIRLDASMTVDEVRANLDYFVDRRAVNEVVLSGVELVARGDAKEILGAVGKKRLRLVTLHSSGMGWTPDLVRAAAEVVDRVVVALTPPSPTDWASVGGASARVLRSLCLLQGGGVRAQTSTVLLRRVLPILEEVAWTIDALGIEAPTFLFPFAGGGLADNGVNDVPTWDEVRSMLFATLERLEPRGPRLKNVPPCYLGEHARFCSKTTTRILVDKRRQLERHAFVPPFAGMRFFAECERCALRPRCDGFFAAYLESKTFPPLRPARGVALSVVTDPEIASGC
jgi:hypothetical protein